MTLQTCPHCGHSYAIRPGSCKTGAILTTSTMRALHWGQVGGSSKLSDCTPDMTQRPVDCGLSRATPLPKAQCATPRFVAHHPFASRCWHVAGTLLRRSSSRNLPIAPSSNTFLVCGRIGSSQSSLIPILFHLPPHRIACRVLHRSGLEWRPIIGASTGRHRGIVQGCDPREVGCKLLQQLKPLAAQ